MISPDRKGRPIEIGVVGKPHGIRGGVNIYIHNDKSQIGDYLEKLFLVNKEDRKQNSKIKQLKPTPKGFIAFIENISTREEADTFRGLRLCVNRHDLPEPAPGEFYVSDLIGLDASKNELDLGRVVASRQSGDIEMITIETDAHQIEVPLVEDYVEQIDFEGNRIWLRNTDELPRSKKTKRN